VKIKLTIGIISLQVDEELMFTIGTLGQLSPSIEVLLQISRMDAHDREQLTREFELRPDTESFKLLPAGDDGLFDAMNTIRKLASGDYLWYLNAGDAKAGQFSLEALLAMLEKPTNYGFQSIQINGDDAFVRPGKGKHFPFREIGHQSSIYHVSGFSQVAYQTSLRVSADRTFNADCERICGWQYIEKVLSVFYLGGLSNTFEWRYYKHYREENLGLRVKFLVRFILGKFLGRKRLLRMLARGKYDQLETTELIDSGIVQQQVR